MLNQANVFQLAQTFGISTPITLRRAGLESFLTPSARDEEILSYQTMREKFLAGRRGRQ